MRLRPPVVEAAPPPPPLDRGIYLKSYIGQANPDVGNIWTEGYNTNTLHGPPRRNQDARRCTVSASAGSTATGCVSTHGRVSRRRSLRRSATSIRVAAASRPARTSTRPTSIAGWGSPTPTSTSDAGAASRPTSARASAFATISVDGLKDINVPQGSSFFGADHTNTNFAWALYAGTSYDITPQLSLDLSYRYANLGTASSGVVSAFDDSAVPTAASSSRTSRRTTCCWASATSSSTTAPLYAVK